MHAVTRLPTYQNSKHGVNNHSAVCTAHDLRLLVPAGTPAFIVVAAVPDDMPLEAAGLEEYFIGKLQPPANLAGKFWEGFAIG